MSLHAPPPLCRYFPANLAHTILGMADGCKFVAGYNSPSFDEREAFSASSWLPTMPDHALAQVWVVGLARCLAGTCAASVVVLQCGCVSVCAAMHASPNTLTHAPAVLLPQPTPPRRWASPCPRRAS
jgi:hypothetical protein